MALEKTSFIIRNPPLCATLSPKGTGLKCDVAARTGITALSQVGDTAAGEAKARIAGDSKERQGNL